MKLILATLSLAFASVKASSLRVQKSVVTTDNFDNGNNVNQKLLNSEIVLQGTTGEPTSEDLEFIGKALVSSYNDVHWEAGHFMAGADTAVTSSVSSIFEVQTPVLIWIWPGFLCRHCPDDDAMGSTSQSLLLTAISDDCAGLCQKEATAELEVNFCNRIKSSQGSSYLSSTTACGISFDAETNETNNNNNNQHVVVHPSTNTDKKHSVATLDTTIVLKGVGFGEATEDEKAILAKAFVAAYNDVHWKDSHYLNDAEIPFIASKDFGTDGTTEVVDTNTLYLDIVSPVMIWIWPGFLCRHCPDDDAMGLSDFDVQAIKSNDFDKEAVEVAFCRKIQNSVSNKLASTKSCSLAVENIIE